MWDSYLSIGGTEVVNGTRLRRNIATGPCPTGMFKPLKSDPLGEAHEALNPPEEAMTFDNISAAPWYDPQVPASELLLGFDFDGAGQSGLGDTRRSVSALEGLADGQIFTSTRSQGREARFTVVAAGLSQGALEYARSWLSAVLDGSICGDGGGRCDLFDVQFFSECPPPFDPYFPAMWEAQLNAHKREMLRCSTLSGPLPGEIFVTDEGMWTQKFEFTIGSELPGTYTVDRRSPVAQSPGPSPIVDFFRNLIENPRGIAASGDVEVGRNLITDPSFETNLAGWTASSPSPITSAISRVPINPALGGDGSWMLRLQATKAGISTVLLQTVLTGPTATITPGSTVYASAVTGARRLSGSGSQAFMGFIVFYNSGGSELERAGMGGVDADSGSFNYSKMSVRAVAPAGAATCRIVFVDTAVSASVAEAIIDSVQLLSGDVASQLYSDTELDGLTAIGGASQVGELSFAWAGTAHASQTIISYSNPARWVSNASTTKVARINSGGRDAVLVRSPGGAGVFAGATMTLDNIVPGGVYFPSFEVLGWETAQTIAGAAVRWLTSAGVLISETSFWGSGQASYMMWSPRSGGPLTAPATAARAEVVVKLQTTASRVLLSNAMLSPAQVSPFFDGDTIDTPTRDYEWEGARHASASSSTPVESTVIIDPLADPSCPPVPTPPRPPSIDESCGDPVQSWSRFFYAISSTGIPEALDMIPEITLKADQVLDAARISLLPNPDALDPGALATEPVASWVLAYLPANTPITINALNQWVTASIGGQELPADHLLSGMAGQPLTWPTLTCGQGYVLVVDTPYQGAGGPIIPEVSVRGRVMYR